MFISIHLITDICIYKDIFLYFSNCFNKKVPGYLRVQLFMSKFAHVFIYTCIYINN